ncbi:hypothetical protein HK104_010747 [Borealophlyctis nickersoniae]|nr:hypothetical protein HK104_010747 [Borealophlyctis nickersoniae]
MPEPILIRHHRVHGATLKATLLYLYAGQASRDVPPEMLEDWLFLCRQWKVGELATLVEGMIKASQDARVARSRAGREVVMVRDVKGVSRDLGVLLWWIMWGGNMWAQEEHMISARSHIDSVDTALFAEKMSAFKDRTHVRLWGAADNKFEQPLRSERGMDALLSSLPSEDTAMGMALLTASAPDIIIDISGTKFPCHRSILTRSDYFSALLSGRYLETHLTTNTHLPPTISLTSTISSPQTFRTILEFLYTDHTSTVTPHDAHSLLITADLLLLPRLTSRTQTYITTLPSIPPPGPYTFLRTAWSLSLHRLEQHVTRYFADHLEEEGTKPEFRDLVRESAEMILGRQETDTVVFVDDLRFWCGREVDGGDVGAGVWEEVALSEGGDGGYRERKRVEYVRKMRVLEGVLEAVGIDM